MRKKNKPEIKRDRRGIPAFLLSFIVALCVLGSLFYLFFIYMSSSPAETKQEDIPYISEYRPHIGENLNLLLLGCDEPQSPPSFITVFHYDAQQGLINCIALPAQAVCGNGSRSGSIADFYDYSGVYGATEAIEGLLGVKIDKYMRIQRTGVSNLCDFFGGLPYTIREDKVIGGQSFFKGEQLLDGRRISSLIFAGGKGNAANVKLQSELVGDLLKRGFTKKMTDKYELFLSSIFYNCETSLSQTDFLIRQTGFLNRLKLDSMVINSTYLKGAYSADYSRFTPDNGSLKEIQALFENQGS